MKALAFGMRLTKHAPPEMEEAGFVPFSWNKHGAACRALLNEAYSSGGGELENYQVWRRAVETDPEFDPLCCVVLEGKEDGAVLGFAHCWSTGFVKDLAVRSSARRQGYGRALMLKVFVLFAGRGLELVWLKVRPDNSSGAVEFY